MRKDPNAFEELVDRYIQAGCAYGEGSRFEAVKFLAREQHKWAEAAHLDWREAHVRLCQYHVDALEEALEKIRNVMSFSAFSMLVLMVTRPTKEGHALDGRLPRS